MPPTLLDILLQSFADLRAAAAAAGSDDEKLESALSTAEQIGVLEDAILHSHFFGDRALRAQTLAGSLVGSLARRSPRTWPSSTSIWHGVVEPRSKEDGRAVAGVPGGRPRGDRHPVMSGTVTTPAPSSALRGQLLGRPPRRSPTGPTRWRASCSGIVDDVDRALREPLEIFPVCHHSPASALAMVRRLREKQPKVDLPGAVRGPARRC